MRKWGFAALVCAVWLVGAFCSSGADAFVIADYDAEVRKADGRVDFEDFLRFAQAYGVRVGENATIEAAFDLDMDGVVGFGDFLMFVKAYGKAL